MDKLEESVRSFCDIKNINTPTLPPTSPLTVVREAKVHTIKILKIHYIHFYFIDLINCKIIYNCKKLICYLIVIIY